MNQKPKSLFHREPIWLLIVVIVLIPFFHTLFSGTLDIEPWDDDDVFENYIGLRGVSTKLLVQPSLARQISNKILSPPIPIEKLTNSDEADKIVCPPGFNLIKDVQTLNDHAGEDNAIQRKIPKIVHMTSKSRCVSPAFGENIEKWKFHGYKFYFHDDEAVHQLLYERDWSPLVPHLVKVLNCITSMTAKVDIWRYLVIWEYGGIYSDIDSSPNIFNGTTILPDDDAYFVVEQLGIPSQYFFAASPSHPIMYFAVEWALHNLMDRRNIRDNQPPHTTGPKALGMGFSWFTGKTYYSGAGVYNGEPPFANRSVKIEGKKKKSDDIVERESIRGKIKVKLYQNQNMTHFLHERKEGSLKCWVHLLALYDKEAASL
mmetsp:Transcript_25572/g.59002  ORF Transcript_25572/g.59002 Transcript_25572/m.59002 type:complete len:373 (-) Transcript_25572:59-1177(-)